MYPNTNQSSDQAAGVTLEATDRRLRQNNWPKLEENVFNRNILNVDTNRNRGFYYYIKRRKDGRQGIYRLREGVNYDFSKLLPSAPVKIGKRLFLNSAI